MDRMGIVFLELRGCWIVLVGGDPLQSFPVCCDRALLFAQTLDANIHPKARVRCIGL